MPDYLTNRQEFVFLYDIVMGNPNGDPDENRPRRLPDGTFYVTDVRLKRFIRDFVKMQGQEILVDNIEGRTTNLTGRVGDYLEKQGKAKANGKEIVDIILDSFVDARLFGSSLAFKKQGEFDIKPEPKTLTGAVQINHGLVMHPALEVTIRGTSTFGSEEDRTQGTFTEYNALRYALIGFNGVANQYNAQKSRLTQQDYETMLAAMWRGVRAAANTRTKVGQNPRLLIAITYKPDSEFQFGNLSEYIAMTQSLEAQHFENTNSYTLTLEKLKQRLEQFQHHIQSIRYCLSPDLQLEPASKSWLETLENLGYDDA
jgi:CRISPR-associated protein Csh2